MFVFRNYTIENLFPEGTAFSGYGDISVIPSDEKTLVWFYQAPVNFDDSSKLKELESMKDKLLLIVSSLKTTQTLYIISLIDIYPTEIIDSNHSISDEIHAFNILAQDIASQKPQIRFIDAAEYFEQFPRSSWINWRFYFISQMIVSPEVASGFADWFNKRISQIDGSRKKCLVLDLDNTLWGGILGEDGVDGIKIGGDYPGNAFLYFQEAIISLSKTGIIIAVCSKNNEADVLDAWEKNPFIKLNRQYISAYRINWNNKVDNIKELATELNIGLDSMVFIDDNPVEREAVRQQLPMVAVPDFPKKPYGLVDLYSSILKDYFRSYSLTNEDKLKTEQYQANAQRVKAATQFADYNEFLASLDIKIKILPADNFNMQRIAQMTQKTNQFNLTTHRYTEADIKNFMEAGHKVFCVSVSDRFGDNGITGASIIKVEKDNAYIDSFLLSCRVLGKGVETAFLYSLLNKLFEEGFKKVDAEYIPTAKNSQVSDFYERHGFDVIEDTNDGKKYVITLTKPFEISNLYSVL